MVQMGKGPFSCSPHIGRNMQNLKLQSIGRIMANPLKHAYSTCGCNPAHVFTTPFEYQRVSPLFLDFPYFLFSNILRCRDMLHYPSHF